MKQLLNSPEPTVSLADLNTLVQKAIAYANLEDADPAQIDCKPLVNFSGRVTGLNLKPLKDAR